MKHCSHSLNSPTIMPKMYVSGSQMISLGLFEDKLKSGINYNNLSSKW